MDSFQTVVLTLIIGLLLVLALFAIQSGRLSGKSKSKYNKSTFLLLGANNAGKTSLFYKLTDDDSHVTTVSSIEPNTADIMLPISNKNIAKKYQLIDYPGHLKYTQLLNKLIETDITLKNLKGVVYVIDLSSVNISNSASLERIATFLFNLLCITEKLPNGVDFLFAVNKNELFDSTPPNRIRTILEGEINKLAQSVVSDKRDYQEENASDIRDFWLGVIGKPGNKFKFDMLEGNMDFFGGSVHRNDVELWENWLDERVVN